MEKKNAGAPSLAPKFDGVTNKVAAGGAWGVFCFKKVVDKLHNHITRNTPLRNTSFAQRRGKIPTYQPRLRSALPKLLGSNG